MAGRILLKAWRESDWNDICVLSCAVAGANTGVYLSLSDKITHEWYETFGSGLLCGSFGALGGYFLPVIAPILVLSVPGYIAGSVVSHSRKIESLRKAETQAVPNHHENQTMEVPRESQLR
jgi:hypothetical protein